MTDEEATVAMVGHEHTEEPDYDPRYLADFEKKYRRKARKKSPKESCNGWIRKSCSKKAIKKSVFGNFPFVKIMRGYNILRDLPNDVIAGMTVGIMQIPQGMAYASLASLPPICGLYTSLFGPLIYFFFGSSKHASMGTIAVVSLMIAAVLDTQLEADDVTSPAVLNSTLNGTLDDLDAERAVNARKIQIATALSFVSGLIMMVLGKLGLGFVTTYMSEYLISGFTTGVAVHVVSSQMKNILGLKIMRFNGIFKVIKTWIELFRNIADTNWVPVVTSVISMIIIYVIKTQINERFKHRLRIPLPIELIVVILGTVVSHFGQFKVNFGVTVVGEIPAGIPLPQIPDVTLVTSHIGDAVIIGVIAFAQSVSMAKTLALKNKYSVNANQEQLRSLLRAVARETHPNSSSGMVWKDRPFQNFQLEILERTIIPIHSTAGMTEMFAYATGSVLCSIFSGYIPAASVARSVVQDGAGGITQIASLAGCCVVLVVVMAVGPLFYSLPSCVLSSVIFVNLRSMFRQTLQLPVLWRKSKWDFSIWIVTFLCVIILDADIGLGIGIIFSILTVVCRTQRSGFVSKGEVDSTEQYRSGKRYDYVRLLPSVKILTFEAPLYFANSELFVNRSYTETGVDPIKIKRKRTVIISKEKKKQKKLMVKDDVEAAKTKAEDTKTGNGISSDVDVYKKTMSPEFDLEYLVFDLSGVTFIDTMGAKALSLAVSEFESIDVQVYIVGIREEVMDILQSTEFIDKHRSQLYMNLTDALATIHVHEQLDTPL